jgi:SWIM zinc finger.
MTANKRKYPVDSSDELAGRIDRAFRDIWFVERIAPRLYEVQSMSGETYRTDPTIPACTCYWFQHYPGYCKHALRALFEVGIPPSERKITQDYD